MPDVWIAVHAPVNAGGQVIHHRQESASIIPAEHVEKMDNAARNSCIKVSEEAARRMFPDLYAAPAIAEAEKPAVRGDVKAVA